MKNQGVMTCVISVGAMLIASAAPAATISSSSYGVSANLNVVGALSASLGPVATASGSAPGAYDVSDSLLTLHQSLALIASPLLSAGEQLNGGVITATARSDYPATPRGSASATVADLSAGLFVDTLLLPPALIAGIDSKTVRSSAWVDAGAGLSVGGSTVLEQLALGGSVLGSLGIGGGLFASPAANTVLVDLLGLRIVLNEQTVWGDGISSLGIATNAIHASFDNFLLGTQLLNGDIIIAHSQAEISGYSASAAVPEPASWAMLIAGFGLVGFAMRARPRSRIVTA